MLKRTIVVEGDGLLLRAKRNQLLVEGDGGARGQVPIEDIGVLVLDSNGVRLTSPLLVKLLEAGAITVVSDRRHLPVGLLIPMAGNTLMTERVRFQLRASRPLHKNLWKRIVRSKISCQASLLPRGSAEREHLERLASDVRSGDQDHAEARAAQLYWSAFFRDVKAVGNFRRARDGKSPNNLLNYGYSVLRAAVARSICGAGLLPMLGIHHHGRYDPFPLADDLMEPFRPWVDRTVRELVGEGRLEVTGDSRKRLLGVLSERVYLDGKAGPLLVAMQKMASSLAGCYQLAGDPDRPAASEVAERLLVPWSVPDDD